MTKEEFIKAHCKLCGSQRCGGPDDFTFRGGCTHYVEWVREQSQKFIEKFCRSCADPTCLGPYDVDYIGGCKHREEMFSDNL